MQDSELSPEGHQSAPLVIPDLPEELWEGRNLDNAPAPVASYANCSGDDYKFSIFKPCIE